MNQYNPLKKLSMEFKNDLLKSIYNKKIYLAKSAAKNPLFNKNNLKDLFLMQGIKNQTFQINEHGNTAELDSNTFMVMIKNLKKGNIRVDEFMLEISKTYTLKILSAHLLSPILKKFAYELFLFFDKGININIYITNGLKKSYNLHLDSEAFFIKQILGVKEWYFPIDERGEYLKDNHRCLRGNQKSENLFKNKIKDYKKFIVEKDNCLHSPLGYPHYAISKKDGLSIHLTISIHEYTGMDITNFIFYISNSKLKYPLQYVDEESLNILLGDKDELIKKWERFLLIKKISILKKGYINIPSHFLY